MSRNGKKNNFKKPDVFSSTWVLWIWIKIPLYV